METLFYVVCFFPFIKWFGIGWSSDVQPYCLIISVFLLLYYAKKNKITLIYSMYNFYRLIITGLIVGTVFTIINSGFEFSASIRYFATYISLILISYFGFVFCKKRRGFNESKIKIIINVYLVVGIIQKYVNSSFCYGIIANARTTSNRGSISLSSEPSFYGYLCIFLMILVLDFKSNRILYLLNLLFQICFVAKSSVTILYLLIFAFVFFICSLKKVNVNTIGVLLAMTFALVLGGYYFMTSSSNAGQRVAFFVNAFISQKDFQGFIKAVMNDESVAIRVRNIVVCLLGFTERIGLPYGFNTGKLQSGYGSIMLTMGWIGVAIIFDIFRFCRNAYDGQMKKVLPIFITIIMFSAIQVSNPVFAFLVGYFVFLSENNKSTDNQTVDKEVDQLCENDSNNNIIDALDCKLCNRRNQNM